MLSDEALRRVLPSPAVELAGDLVRALLWVAALGGWASVVFIYGRLLAQLFQRPPDHDFTIFYVSARMLHDGHAMYADVPAAYRALWSGPFLGNLNPPHVQLALYPLGWLSYGAALWLWIALSGTCALATTCWVFRAIRVRSVAGGLLGGLLAFASAPFVAVAVTGELSFVLALPFTAAWLAARRGAWLTAGVWVGVCASAKPFLLPVVALVVIRGKQQALAGVLAGMGGCLAAGVLAFGPGAYGAWVRNLELVGWWWLAMNASVFAVTSRALAQHPGTHPLVDAPNLVATAWAGLSALIGLATLWSWLRHRRGRSDDADWLVSLSASLLISPLGWVYYLPLALGPVGALLKGGPRATGLAAFAALLGAMACLFVPTDVVALDRASPLQSVTIVSAYFWGLLLLWLAALRASGSVVHART